MVNYQNSLNHGLSRLKDYTDFDNYLINSVSFISYRWNLCNPLIRSRLFGTDYLESLIQTTYN